MHVIALPDLSLVQPAAWNALGDPNYPFTDHAFLCGLEATGCVGGDTGWWPLHLLAVQGPQGTAQTPLPPGAQVLGAVPLYVKAHSMGEFIFDFAWADFSVRNGWPYYPKLVAAVPFSPVSGPRILVHPLADAALVTQALVHAAKQLAGQTDAHSVHWLFTPAATAEKLSESGYIHRVESQAVWLNPGYGSFEAFLQTRRHAARKQIRRERKAIIDAGITVQVLRGPDMVDADWQAIRACYLATYRRYGSAPYLNVPMFEWLRREMPEQVVVVLAWRNGERIAGTLNLQKGQHLYGRYWGALQEVPMLHFELAFYRLMELCIEQGWTRFEAGAGGDHKLRRGLEPTLVHSAHWLAQPALHAAVAAHVHEMTDVINDELDELRAASTRRRDGAGV